MESLENQGLNFTHLLIIMLNLNILLNTKVAEQW